MAIIDIPTGILPEEIVNTLPTTGVENKVYRRLVTPDDPMLISEDFIWNGTEFIPFSYDMKIYASYFEIYQESVQETVAEMEQTIAEQGAIIEAQAAAITELEEAVFPKAWVSFEMNITSLVMTHLDLVDEEDNIIEEGAFTTDIYESEPMTFQTEITKGTYYLKNGDGYALGLPNGNIKSLVYDDSTTVELGEVEVIMIAPQKGGKK